MPRRLKLLVVSLYSGQEQVFFTQSLRSHDVDVLREKQSNVVMQIFRFDELGLNCPVTSLVHFRLDLMFPSIFHQKSVEQYRQQNKMSPLISPINAEQVYTQFCVHLYLCQWKCNRTYAINHVSI